MSDSNKRNSFNAFGDDPVQVRPCKCGYQWREGALPEEVCSHGGGEYVVVCFRCKAPGELKATPLWAVEAWNNSHADPIGTAQERELINYLCRSTASVEEEQAADALQSRIAEVERLGGDWFDKAIRDHCDEHGPSGGAWNISMILERLHRARAALSQDVKR